MRAAGSGIRLMMTTDTVGGVWIYATTLARCLGLAGNEVQLVTLGPRPTATQRETLRGCRGVSLIETDLQLEWQDPAGADVCHAEVVLGAIADRFEPDLVHLNSFREATFEWDVPTLVVAHSCVNSWADACRETDAFTGDGWNAYSLLVQAGLRNAGMWVAPTWAFREQLAFLYGLSQGGVVIWNGVEARQDSCVIKRPLILSAGRLWDKAKNLSVIASVAAGIEWPLRIAGPSGLHGPTVSASASNCEFAGEMSHAALLAEMESASIFVSPALYEPFGLSVLEAASAGCALLLSDIPTFRELWDGAAAFFDPRDPDQFLASLRSLCRDEAQRVRLQRAAAKRARHYPLSNTVYAYASLYASLLAGTAGRASNARSREMLA
jgi:glycosyltransferase involved in cell wall biosynthesis